MDDGEECFRTYVQSLTQPCVFKTKSFFQAVKLSTFAPENLEKILSRELIKFRVGKRDTAELQWEVLCGKAEASIEEFLQWHAIEDCERVDKSRKRLQEIFGACCRSHYWCYADYMYMKDLFHNHPEVLRLLNWDSLGFCNKDGKDSTMWLGSKGAHTLCHYDTYGFNIVVQVSGAKKWILFPPSNGHCLYPTRIPYEESSIFSEVNIACPDLKRHERFSRSHSCIVELKPGDVLYVPHHWWHYVENMELSVSINLWYELPGDCKSRLKESITRLIVGSCVPNVAQPDVPWINPTEDENSVKSIEDGLKYLNQSLAEINLKEITGEAVSRPEMEAADVDLVKQTMKRFKNIDGEVQVSRLCLRPHDEIMSDLVSPVDGLQGAQAEGGLLHASKRAKRGSEQGSEAAVAGPRELSYKEFVQCLTHSDVLDAISKVALNRFGDG